MQGFNFIDVQSNLKMKIIVCMRISEIGNNFGRILSHIFKDSVWFIDVLTDDMDNMRTYSVPNIVFTPIKGLGRDRVMVEDSVYTQPEMSTFKYVFNFIINNRSSQIRILVDQSLFANDMVHDVTFVTHDETCHTIRNVGATDTLQYVVINVAPKTGPTCCIDGLPCPFLWYVVDGVGPEFQPHETSMTVRVQNWVRQCVNNSSIHIDTQPALTTHLNDIACAGTVYCDGATTTALKLLEHVETCVETYKKARATFNAHLVCMLKDHTDAPFTGRGGFVNANARVCEDVVYFIKETWSRVVHACSVTPDPRNNRAIIVTASPQVYSHVLTLIDGMVINAIAENVALTLGVVGLESPAAIMCYILAIRRYKSVIAPILINMDAWGLTRHVDELQNISGEAAALAFLHGVLMPYYEIVKDAVRSNVEIAGLQQALRMMLSDTALACRK